MAIAACAPVGVSDDDTSTTVTIADETANESADTTNATDDETASEVGLDVPSSAADFTWDDSEAEMIDLGGSSISTESTSVSVEGTSATITAGGTYVITGELADGRVLVDSSDESTVRLVLDGVSIASSDGPAIGVASAADVVIILADGTSNTLADGSSYSHLYVEANLDAALVSKADLAIGGEGSLTVVGNYNDAIASSDGLVIASGIITVEAIDDGIRGKDYLVVEDGDFEVTAGGDGLKSDNEEDATSGNISILAGEFAIEAAGDGIAAQTELTIATGTFTITTSGDGDVDSAKGLKAGANVTIADGTYSITSIDDGVHSNGVITIDGGDFTIATGDDGMHADASLTVADGSIVVTESYEGLESAVVTIDGGEIEIRASDDGINVAGGTDGSGQEAGPGGFGGGGRGGPDEFAANDDQWLYINGGTIVVYASGDGIDVNGHWSMAGGTLIVHGPTENMNGAFDVNGTFEISEGFLVGAGSAGMAESPDTNSGQASLSVQFNGAQSDSIQIQDSDGTVLLTFQPAKTYQAFVFSSPDLVGGETYEFFMGATGSGDEIGGVYDASSSSGTSIGTAAAY